jgi:hypothetical protein
VASGPVNVLATRPCERSAAIALHSLQIARKADRVNAMQRIAGNVLLYQNSKADNAFWNDFIPI